MLEAPLKRVLQAVFGGGEDIDISTEFSELKEALRTLTEASVDTGVADATSAVNHLDDSAKAWPTNAFTDLIVEITAGTGEGQIRKIASNNATSLVPVTNFATAPDATSQYRIGFFGKMTGDITDRAARLLGVIYGSQAQQILQRATTYDLLIQLRHAGAEIDPRAIRALTSSDVVDLSDKWARQLGLVEISRVLGAALSATNPVIVRLTDGTAVITSPIKAQLPTALTVAGNLKQSIEETAIAVPSDIQARYPLKTTRDIAAPAINTDYYLPETGNIDLSNFIHSSWYIYATTNKPDAIQLEACMEGGTTWYKLEGYEIAVTDFVVGTWNQIDCPLMLMETRLLVSTGDPAPEAISMAVVRKA